MSEYITWGTKLHRRFLLQISSRITETLPHFSSTPPSDHHLILSPCVSELLRDFVVTMVISHLSFCAWPIVPSTTVSSFVRVAFTVLRDSVCSFKVGGQPIVRVDHICFVDKCIAAHVGCYCLLYKVNNTEINKHLYKILISVSSQE